MPTDTTLLQPRPAYRMLVVITGVKPAQRAAELLDRGRVPLQYRFLAKGTASSEMLEMLGLGSSDKVVLLSMLPRPFAGTMLRKMQIELSLGAINSGIAFTVPISGSSNVLMKMMQSLQGPDIHQQPIKEGAPMSECDFSLVMAIVDQGYSEEVMNAARPVGARGGTVFHSRRLVNEETMKFWGISIQPEKEIILVVAPNSHKKAIMQAIGEACGFQSAAHGVVLSLPVEEAIGLKLPTEG